MLLLRQVPFGVGPPRAHCSMCALLPFTRYSNSVISAVHHMLGNGSHPGSQGCSKMYDPPRTHTASQSARKCTSKMFASVTRLCSALVMSALPQVSQPLNLTGRGPGCEVLNLARDQVLHGGPPITRWIMPRSAWVMSSPNVLLRERSHLESLDRSALSTRIFLSPACSNR